MKFRGLWLFPSLSWPSPYAPQHLLTLHQQFMLPSCVIPTFFTNVFKSRLHAKVLDFIQLCPWKWSNKNQKRKTLCLARTVWNQLLETWSEVTGHGRSPSSTKNNGRPNFLLGSQRLDCWLVWSSGKLLLPRMTKFYNSRWHTARSVKAWMENQNIQTLPAQSPDLNPMENLWKILKLKMEICKPKTK